MIYKEAVAFLNQFICYERSTGWKYGPGAFDLGRFHRLLEILGRPQLSYPTIHLAGSDGKGSTAAILSSILRQAGYRVGLYTSPHLEDIRERISIDGEWIEQDDFARAVEQLKSVIDQGETLPKSYATFFELLTALAFLHFQSQAVDVAVIETGLGGRLDATNALQPDLTIITHLSLEHTETLGDTLEKIAAEKLAICKPGVPAVIAHQKRSIRPFIREWLNERAIPRCSVSDSFELLNSECDGYWRTLTVRDIDERRTEWQIRLPLLGHYQVDNALSALTATKFLPRFADPLGPKAWRRAVLRGCEQAFWPGRYEILEAGDSRGLTRVVLDGAHTARGAQTLSETLDEVEGPGGRTLIFGFLRGKNIEAMCRSLIRPQDTLIFTNAPTPRGLPAQEIIEKYRANRQPNCPEGLVIEDPLKALRYGLSISRREESTLVVAGSLYLVGLCRTELRKFETLRDGRRTAA